MQAVEQSSRKRPLLTSSIRLRLWRDDPHVHLDGLPSADRLDLALLDRAQQFHLRGHRQFADLVEEQRAARGFEELAGVLLGRAGEGALLVAEQDRLHEIVGDRAAIDRDEGLGAPVALAVDGARDQLLADAGLALDQHRDVRRRGLLGAAQHGKHLWAAGDDVLERQRAGLAAFDAGKLVGERALFQRVAQRHLQPLGADRLHHEIDRARAHRRHHIVDAAMRGLHDHRHIAARLAHPRQHAEPVEIGHDEIEHHAVESLAAGQQRRGLIAAFGDSRLMAEFPHHVVEQAPLNRIVIDDENTRTHWQHSKRNCAVSRQSARVALKGR